MGDGQDGGTRSLPTAAAHVPTGWEGVNRILTVRLDNVGDIVMLGPALRALRGSFRSAHITLMASPGGSQVAPLLPWLDAVMPERVVWQDASSRLPLDAERELALVARIAAGGFDAALIFTSFSQSPWPPAYACYLAGIPRRAAQAGDFGGSLLTHVVPALERDAHQVDRNLHLLEGLGLPRGDHRLEVQVPPDAQTAASALLEEAGLDLDQPFAVLAPGASCSARRYPAERFSVVAGRLARAGLPVVLVGSANEGELAATILEGNADLPVLSLVGRTGVPELAAVLARAAVVVTNDSGPMHLADALDRPLVVLFSGTDLESQWRPRRSPARILRRPTPCSPCYRFTCPYHLECLDIPPDEVVEHALSLLSESEAGNAMEPSGELCVGSGA